MTLNSLSSGLYPISVGTIESATMPAYGLLGLERWALCMSHKYSISSD